jgi:fructose-1,6-bisphosphatase
MAYLVEKAGGLAYAAKGPMLDLCPDTLHKRAPILLGSRNLVAKAWEASAGDAG